MSNYKSIFFWWLWNVQINETSKYWATLQCTAIGAYMKLFAQHINILLLYNNYNLRFCWDFFVVFYRCSCDLQANNQNTFTNECFFFLHLLFILAVTIFAKLQKCIWTLLLFFPHICMFVAFRYTHWSCVCFVSLLPWIYLLFVITTTVRGHSRNHNHRAYAWTLCAFVKAKHQRPESIWQK